MIHLFLFDVDGVLVDARAYLKALQDTVAHFARQMGMGRVCDPPTEEEVRAFEANGLTSEWDSGPTCVAALLLERLRVRNQPSLLLPSHWPDALATLAAQPPAGDSISRPDYVALARKVGQRLVDGASPAQAARAVLWEEALAIPGQEHAPPALAALLDTLLGRIHDFYRAPVTRHFQHLAIGSQAVAQTYDVSPDFESPAYLLRYDRPLLTPATRARLHDSQVRAALYTTRPSLPPAEAGEPAKRPSGTANGYSPEAEMARSLVGLEAWPLVGRGRMRWLAQRTGEDLDGLIKPFPVQALAAIGAASSGREADALEAALALHREGQLRPPLADLGAVTLHVFEDNVSGLAAAERGVEALERADITVMWRPYGIAPANNPKATALTARGVPVYPSVNEAVLDALKEVSKER